VLPNLSLVWVIVFVLLLTVILDRLLLRPLTRVMGEREAAIRTARDLAETSRGRAEAATEEFDAKTRAARADVYRQMEEKRRVALERRAEIVGETRREVDHTLSDATARVRAQAAAARTQLERDADQLASTIVERVLGRKAS
jgi:F-type H+-transporting ATPase subunit b